MRKALYILFFICISCDPFCQSEKLSEEDQLKLKVIDQKHKEFKISSDKCLPFGYYNVQVIDENIIDTLKLHQIFNEVENAGIRPKRMQVFGKKNNFRFILYKAQGLHLILLPSDL